MPKELDTSVALRWYVLCSTTTEEVGSDLELTPAEAAHMNSELWRKNSPWRWVPFSEKGQAA